MSGVLKQRAHQLAPNIPEYSLSAWTAELKNSFFQTRFITVTSSLLPLLHAIHDILLDFLIPTSSVSHGSSVSIVSEIRAEQLRNRGSIHGTSKRGSSKNVYTRSGTHTGYGGLFPIS